MVEPTRTLIAALGLLILAGLGEATAQVGAAEALLPALKSKHGLLDSILNGVVEAYARGVGLAAKDSGRPPTGEAAAAARVAAALAPVSKGAAVAVTLRIEDASKVAAVVRFLRANGADPRNVGEDYIEAYVPVSLLLEASGQPGVANVRAVIPPQPKRGPVTSEGVRAHGADNWHAAGFSGRGVKVGVIDGGFISLERLMGSELPASITARCYHRHRAVHVQPRGLCR